MEDDLVQVKIPLFEGPLDLLLHLIRKNEVDIYDIPVAVITGQYLEYLEMMEALNIEVAGEFLVMAATLIQIKSKMLLPPKGDDEEEEDPRLEIALPLLEYIRFKEAAGWLDDRPWLERDVFVRGENDDISPANQEELTLFNLNLFELIDAFKEVLDKSARLKDHTVRVEAASLAERVAQIMEQLRTRENIRFTELFDPGQGIGDLVLTFLAVLELARMGFLRIYQETAFSPIRLQSRKEAFEVGAEMDEFNEAG